MKGKFLQKKKRFLSLLGAFSLLFVTVLPILPKMDTYAYEGTKISGAYGEGYWDSTTNTLTVTKCSSDPSATSTSRNYPWSSYASTCKKLVFGSSVTTIGRYAFYEFKNITSISLPSVKTIDVDAFGFCTSLTSIDAPVCTYLGNACFSHCKALTSVTFPKVEEMDFGAFYECTGLVEINFPCLTTIGKQAFFKCSELIYLIIPKVTTIGDYAFDLNRGSSVTTYLTTYVVSDNSLASYDWRGSARTYSPRNEIYIYVHGEAINVIPFTQYKNSCGIGYLNGNKFYVSYISGTATSYTSYPWSSMSTSNVSLIFADNVTSTGDYIFSSFQGTSVDLNNVTEIGKKAFYDCDNLKTNLDLSKVTSIGDSAFYGSNFCVNDIDLSSCTYVGKNAFYYSGASSDYYLTTYVNSRQSAVLNYDWVGSHRCFIQNPVYVHGEPIDIKNSITGTTHIYGNAYGTGYLIDDTLYIAYMNQNKTATSINNYPWNAKVSLGTSALNVVFTDNVTRIQPYALSSCNSTNMSVDFNNVTYIDKYAFEDCTGITGVLDLSNVEYIGNNAFYGCSKIVSVNAQNATEIGTNAFYRCLILANADISSATNINSSAFCNCSNLSSVDMSSVLQIGASAFKYCESLVDIVLPACLSIGNDAFYVYRSTKLVTNLTSQQANVLSYDWSGDNRVLSSSLNPTVSPTKTPSTGTTTPKPTSTVKPTASPTSKPTASPTVKPSSSPSDKNAPIINGVDTTHDANGNTFTVSNTENDLVVRAKVRAVDSDSVLYYSFYKGTEPVTSALIVSNSLNNYLDITYADGNGSYCVTVKDSSSNVSTPVGFTINAWDTEKPSMTVNADEDIVAKSRTVKVSANDGSYGKYNLAKLPTAPYYMEKCESGSLPKDYDEIPSSSWKSSSTFTIKENGSYRIYVRDSAGNITWSDENGGSLITYTKIDNSNPNITIGFNADDYELLSDGRTLRFAVSVAGEKVFDDGNYQYSLVDNKTKEEIPVYAYSSDEVSDRFVYVALLNDSSLANSTKYPNSKKWFVFEADSDIDWTLTVTNNAGGKAVKNITVDYGKYVRFLDGIPVRDGSSYITIKKNPEYDYTNSNVLLTPVLSGISTIEDKECFYWTDKAGITLSSDKGSLNNTSLYTWLKAGNIPVDVNKTYYLYVLADDGFIYTKSVTVSNIDKNAPTVSAQKSGTSNISIRAVDDLSGVDYIRVYGSSMESLKEFNNLNGLDSTQIYTDAYNGTYYIEAYDKVGNCSERLSFTFYGREKPIPITYYRVSFRSITNGILKEEMVAENGTATPPSSSSMAWDGYTFVGWDTSWAGIKKTTNIKPVYVENPSDDTKTYYTVAFKSDDGAVIYAQAVEKGGTATPPTPTKKGYVFTGWSNGYANIQKDTECIAIFEEEASASATPTKSPTTGATTGNAGNTGNTTPSSSGGSSGGTTSTTTSSTVLKATPTPTVSPSPTTSPDTEGTEEVNPEEIPLSEFIKEASLLPISSFDNTSSTQNVLMVEDEPTAEEGSSLTMDEFIEGTGTVEETQDAEYDSADGVTAGQVVAVIALIGMGGAVAFYFLNKKYFWVDLPF